MAKQTKPKSKRMQVKDLSVAQQELTTDQASKIKGGTSATTGRITGIAVDPADPNVVYVGGSNRSSAVTQPTKTSLSSPTTKN